MASFGRFTTFFRSSVFNLRAAVVRRAFSTNSRESASYFRSAAPLLLGASAVTAALLASKNLYKNNTLTLFGNVQAATKVESKDPKTERTFIMVKPDGVDRGLTGDIIKRFEQKGFKLVAMKLMQASEDHLRKHYDDLKNLPFFPGLVKHMSSGPVVAMVWEGLGIVKTGRVMLGETDPVSTEFDIP